jgi:hypothetical protein
VALSYTASVTSPPTSLSRSFFDEVVVKVAEKVAAIVLGTRVC